MVKRQSQPQLLSSKSKRAKMDISNSLSSLPKAVLQHTFSFLSTKELLGVAQVCRTFAKLAKMELVKRQKQDKDWRLDYIKRKKFGKAISPLTAEKLLEKSKEKNSAFTERLIMTEIRKDYSGYCDIQMTENILAYAGRKETVGGKGSSKEGKIKKSHFINVERRSDGATFTIPLGLHDRFQVSDWSIVVLVNGLKIHNSKGKEAINFVYWTIPETGRKKQKKLYTIAQIQSYKNHIHELIDYTVNGDYILIKYYSYPWVRHEELWHMMDPMPVKIELPDITLFWSDNGSTEGLSKGSHACMDDGWIMDTNKNSQFLVHPCKYELPGLQARSHMEMIKSSEDYVLVFSGFDAPKYLHCITISTFKGSGIHHGSIRLTIVGENKNAKTLLTVDCQELDYPQPEEDEEMRVFDLETGHVLFRRQYGKRTRFAYSRHSVCSKYDEMTKDDENDEMTELKLMWINWNGKELSICETHVPMPISGQETRLRSVTDSRILFDVEGDNGTYYISYDYILADKSDKHLIDLSSRFYSLEKDYASSNEEDGDEYNIY